MEIKEGWGVDVTNKKATHYYKDGVSLCGKERQKFYMDKFDTRENYTMLLGYTCSLCQKKLKSLYDNKVSK